MCRFKTEEEVVGLANATSSGLAGKVLKKGHLKKKCISVIQDIKARYLTMHSYMHADITYTCTFKIHFMYLLFVILICIY